MRLFASKSKKHEAVSFDIEPTTALPLTNDLAIVVIVKNEAESIAEWLRFHLAASVDRFFIYDDGSTDETISIAQQTVPEGALTVIPWAQRIRDSKFGRAIHNQGLAFAHAVGNFRQQARWMAFIDVDEFLFPTGADSLQTALSKIGHADNVLLPWHMFGRQGHATTPDLIIPNYTQRHRDPYSAKVKGVLNFKCLVNPCKVTKVYVHGFETSGVRKIWNSKGQAFDFGDHHKPDFDPDPALQLNHYYIKSDTHLAQKAAKGSIGNSVFTAAFKQSGNKLDTLARRVAEIERDTIEDRGILQFCERIGFS